MTLRPFTLSICFTPVECEALKVLLRGVNPEKQIPIWPAASDLTYNTTPPRSKIKKRTNIIDICEIISHRAPT